MDCWRLGFYMESKGKLDIMKCGIFLWRLRESFIIMSTYWMNIPIGSWCVLDCQTWFQLFMKVLHPVQDASDSNHSATSAVPSKQGGSFSYAGYVSVGWWDAGIVNAEINEKDTPCFSREDPGTGDMNADKHAISPSRGLSDHCLLYLIPSKMLQGYSLKKESSKDHTFCLERGKTTAHLLEPWSQFWALITR